MGKDEERRMMYLLLQLAPGGLAVVVARDEHPGQARQQVPSAASAASAVPVQGVAQEGLEVRHGALPAPALGGEAREAALEEGVARPELALVAVCGARVHVARPAREGAAGVQALCVSETGQTRCRQSSPSPPIHAYIHQRIDRLGRTSSDPATSTRRGHTTWGRNRRMCWAEGRGRPRARSSDSSNSSRTHFPSPAWEPWRA